MSDAPELTPEQTKLYISRDEAMSMAAKYLATFGKVELRPDATVHYRTLEMIVDWNTTAKLEFKGPITMEAMDGVLAHIAYYKTLLETALEKMPPGDVITPQELREDILRMAGVTP